MAFGKIKSSMDMLYDKFKGLRQTRAAAPVGGVDAGAVQEPVKAAQSQIRPDAGIRQAQIGGAKGYTVHEAVRTPPPMDGNTRFASENEANRAANRPKMLTEADLKTAKPQSSLPVRGLRAVAKGGLALAPVAGAVDAINDSPEDVRRFADSINLNYDTLGGKIGANALNFLNKTGRAATLGLVGNEIPKASAAPLTPAIPVTAQAVQSSPATQNAQRVPQSAAPVIAPAISTGLRNPGPGGTVNTMPSAMFTSADPAIMAQLSEARAAAAERGDFDGIRNSYQINGGTFGGETAQDTKRRELGERVMKGEATKSQQKAYESILDADAKLAEVKAGQGLRDAQAGYYNAQTREADATAKANEILMDPSAPAADKIAAARVVSKGKYDSDAAAAANTAAKAKTDNVAKNTERFDKILTDNVTSNDPANPSKTVVDQDTKQRVNELMANGMNGERVMSLSPAHLPKMVNFLTNMAKTIGTVANTDNDSLYGGTSQLDTIPLPSEMKKRGQKFGESLRSKNLGPFDNLFGMFDEVYELPNGAVVTPEQLGMGKTEYDRQLKAEKQFGPQIDKMFPNASEQDKRTMKIMAIQGVPMSEIQRVYAD